MELAPQGVTDTGTRSQPPPGLGQGLPATRIPASPGSLGTIYHHPWSVSEAAQQTCPPWQLAPTERKGARERGRLLGPTCSGSDTPPSLMASLARINYGAITISPNVQEPFNGFHSSVVFDSDTHRTVARQAPLSRGFSGPGYWSGLPSPPPGDLPDPGIEPSSLASPALAGRFELFNRGHYFPHFTEKETEAWGGEGPSPAGT